MNAGGISFVVVAVLALMATAMLLMWVRRKRIRRRQRAAAKAQRSQRSQRFRRPDPAAGLPTASDTAGLGERAASPANLSLIGTDELAETMRAYQGHRKKWRAAPTSRTQRNANRGIWAAGASFGLGTGSGGSGSPGGYVGGGADGSGCTSSGCGGGGCGGGGCGGGGS
jgi:type II secretory pathway pseudopilin PulG